MAVKLAADAGFHWLRQEFPWEDISRSAARGDFWDHKFDHSAWDKYDHIVALAENIAVSELILRPQQPARVGAEAATRPAPTPPTTSPITAIS
ncbi:hypothetical protein [Candidatus Amarobacter glycogenicus]|uniref:hypothetical protein n=1 Tax=Candidatus Amarobacter glycogenicus TaxID=3140699 RepID=UPI002A0BE97B|nr:hypothetical protein [Dehalococcoidia bacterium]